MLDSLHIQNYRLFKDLKIDKLGQVNLIAGKNNTGKTALLEALRIFLNKCSYEVITNVIYLRGDLEKSKPVESISTLFNESDIFNNWLNYTFKINELGWGITVKPSGKITRHFGNPSTTTMAGEIVDFFNYEYPNDETVYVPFKINSEININTGYWEKIEFNKSEVQDVIDFLNIISPNKIKQISMSNGIRILLENGKVEKLTKWGDGVNRLLSIALALVNAKRKTLLIDEFEVGLHHSIQKQLWEIIFEYSKKWDIQVFATTHSQDTIKAFAEVWNQSEKNIELGNYFRLQYTRNNSEMIKPIFYDNEMLEVAYQQNIETR